MKILSKKELQQIAFNHSSNTELGKFMNLYKNCTAKPYSFLANNTLLASDNTLRLRNNLLERKQKLIIRTEDKRLKTTIQC